MPALLQDILPYKPHHVFQASVTGQYDFDHRRSQGGKGAIAPRKFVENIVILCLKRHFSKQNSVIHRKSNILALPKIFRTSKNFWAGYATDYDAPMYHC